MGLLRSNFNKFVSSQFTENEIDWLIVVCFERFKIAKLSIIPSIEEHANKRSQKIATKLVSVLIKQ